MLTYYQISSDLPIEKRTLWGRLAYGQISKLATATIQADVCVHISSRITDINPVIPEVKASPDSCDTYTAGAITLATDYCCTWQIGGSIELFK